RASTGNQKGNRPVEPINQGAEERVHRRVSQQGGSGNESIRQRPLLLGKPVCRRAGTGGVERRGKQSHQGTDDQQRQPDLARRDESPADHARECAEQGRANTHSRQRDAWSETINEEAARDHENRVNDQKSRIHDAHLFGRDSELLHDALVARARHTSAIEVADEANRHQEEEDAPANRGGLDPRWISRGRHKRAKLQTPRSKLQRNPKSQTPTPAIKLQIPGSKRQRTTKLRTSSTKLQKNTEIQSPSRPESRSICSLELEASLVLGAWCLELFICPTQRPG